MGNAMSPVDRRPPVSPLLAPMEQANRAGETGDGAAGLVQACIVGAAPIWRMPIRAVRIDERPAVVVCWDASPSVQVTLN